MPVPHKCCCLSILKKKNPRNNPNGCYADFIFSVALHGHRGGYNFFHRRVISSSVLPLVSGTKRQTKRAATTQMTP